MSSYFFNGIPDYHMKNLKPVRSALDNLHNVLELVNIINFQNYSKEETENDFDIAIFSGNYSRSLIKKDSGFFSMHIPFSVIEEENRIKFQSKELGEFLDGRLISIFKNAISSSAQGICYEDILFSISNDFMMSKNNASIYVDEFFSLLSQDHGYLRFDDDEKNENGEIHPRYHFDFFYTNSSSVKIGTYKNADLNIFYSLFDKTIPKRYIRD